mgnify:CR=1 FL=1
MVDQTKQLIDTFTSDYMEKLFYFCLKKTGNTDEAENLASDITLNILKALKRGTIPVHFSAWVWRIARNRYSRWVQHQKIKSDRMYGVSSDELDLADDKEDFDEMIRHEDLQLLRRELAFIAKDYREIIVAYYIDDKKIADIANELGKTKEAVKVKLFRSRKMLKEGMDMAREFGVRSYNPESVNFASSGKQPTGLPWKVVHRMIPKNILLQASNNPSTVEELSVELGVAAPYMEEEVKLLTDATLLKKIGNKYITNFYIADKESQMAVYMAQRQNAKERSEATDQLVTDLLPEIKKLNIVRNNMSDDELKWWFVIYTLDICNFSLNHFQIDNLEKRENGENWGFMGFQKTDIPEKLVMGHNGAGNDDNMFWAYKIGDYDLWEQVGELTYNGALLLGDVVRNKRKRSSLTESEEQIWKKLEGRFTHIDSDQNIIPDILIFEKDALDRVRDLIKSHPLFSRVMDSLQDAFDKTVSILKANSNEVLHKQLYYCASMLIMQVRMMTVHDEVEAGRLVVPENPKTSTIAMWLEVR